MAQSEEYIKKLLNNEIIEFKEKTLVLASKSASRIKVLERAGLKFVAIPSLIDEEKLKTEFGEVKAEEVAANYVKRLSHEKAMWVYEHVKNAVVIGADTVAFYKDEILEKPKDEADARRIFTTLSNSIHTVLTGVCIVDDKKVDNFVKVSPIKMLDIPKELQDILVKDKLTYTYAGGYCIDGNLQGRAVFEKEDFNNILGIPIEDILVKLKEAGHDFSK